MCGRYALFTAPDELEKYFEAIISNAGTIEPNYNVTPGAVMPVVAIGRDKIPVITTFRWGLIPHWAKEASIGYKMINARSETLREKPSFAVPFQRQRCAIPSNGFYEWKQTGKDKQPFAVRRTDDEIMIFAGIYDRWKVPDGPDVFSYSIITTQANALISHIHERMPVVLDRSDVGKWLSPQTVESDLLSLMHPLPQELTRVYRVGDDVNKPANNTPALMEEKQGGEDENATEGGQADLGL